MPPSILCCAALISLHATQGQRSKDVSFVMEASKAALRLRSQAATGEAWLKFAGQSYSPNASRVFMI